MLGGYCNDSVGYIVTPDVYGELSYEAAMTFTGPTASAVVMETGKKFVEKLV